MLWNLCLFKNKEHKLWFQDWVEQNRNNLKLERKQIFRLMLRNYLKLKTTLSDCKHDVILGKAYYQQKSIQAV